MGKQKIQTKVLSYNVILTIRNYLSSYVQNIDERLLLTFLKDQPYSLVV